MPSRKRHSSVEGCCICGVDTSTEPFFKSDDISANKNISAQVYQHCFKLGQERSGDLCVDCLSIAKKWLKFRKSSRHKKNFSEVVDSKRTPKTNNTRSRSRRNSAAIQESEKMTNSEKMPSSPEKQENSPDRTEEEQSNEEVFEKEEPAVSAVPPVIEDALSDDDNDIENNEDMDIIDGSAVEFETPCLSPGRPEDITENTTKQEMISVATQTAFLFPALTSPQANANKLPFIDLSKWRQENICCGTIFRGPNGEVLVDPKWLRSSCEMCNRSSQPPTPVETSNSQAISVFDEKLSSLCS